MSIDWWNWESNAKFADWIPIWIIYLIMIQFALAYSVWTFSKVFSPIIGVIDDNHDDESEDDSENSEEDVEEPENERSDITIPKEEE